MNGKRRILIPKVYQAIIAAVYLTGFAVKTFSVGTVLLLTQLAFIFQTPIPV